jgi:alpha-1,6-mannosyltransferase
MRIVQLANFYSATSGGLSTTLRSLARGYTDEGHEVIRIVPGVDDRRYDDGTATVIELAAPALGSTGYRMIRSGRAVTQLLRSLSPESIELSDKATLVGPAAAARRRGSTVVLVSHERLDAILRPRLPHRIPLEPLADRWNRRLDRKVDAVVCASEYAAAEFRRIGSNNVHIVPLGVDLATFRPALHTDLQRHGPVRLTLVSRLSKEKRPELAIDTVRHLAEGGVQVHLDVAGAGPMLNELMAAARGLPVRFHGHLHSQSEVVDLLQRADVTLAPCGIETFGLAALESMACGTPVVAADTGGLPELVAPGTGRIASPNGASFGAAVLACLKDSRGVNQQTTRSHAECFPWQTTSSVLLELLSGLSSVSRVATLTG